jgi:hypothetical protein
MQALKGLPTHGVVSSRVSSSTFPLLRAPYRRAGCWRPFTSLPPTTSSSRSTAAAAGGSARRRCGGCRRVSAIQAHNAASNGAASGPVQVPISELETLVNKALTGLGYAPAEIDVLREVRGDGGGVSFRRCRSGGGGACCALACAQA